MYGANQEMKRLEQTKVLIEALKEIASGHTAAGRAGDREAGARGGGREAVTTTALPDRRIGQHVEIAPHHDLWMQGARTGTVVRVTRSVNKAHEILVLKMDHPQVKRRVRVFADDVKYL